MELITAIFEHANGFELIMFIGSLVYFGARLEQTSKSNKEILDTELKHIVSLMELNHNNLVNDINRLEKKQEESNRIKERLARQEVLVSDIQAMLKSHLVEHHDTDVIHQYNDRQR